MKKSRGLRMYGFCGNTNVPGIEAPGEPGNPLPGAGTAFVSAQPLPFLPHDDELSFFHHSTFLNIGFQPKGLAPPPLGAIDAPGGGPYGIPCIPPGGMPIPGIPPAPGGPPHCAFAPFEETTTPAATAIVNKNFFIVRSSQKVVAIRGGGIAFTKRIDRAIVTTRQNLTIDNLEIERQASQHAQAR